MNPCENLATLFRACFNFHDIFLVQNQITVWCESGIIDPPSLWPTEAECMATCVSIAGNPISKGFSDPSPIDVLQGDSITLTCDDADHYRDDDWSARELVLTCQQDAAFAEPDAWPTCSARPTCPVLPAAGAGTGLEPVDPGEEPPVTDGGRYRCTDGALVTDMGAEVVIPCVYNNVSDAAEYAFADNFGDASYRCRDKVGCSSPPAPTADSGLQLVPLSGNVTGYFEYDPAEYECQEDDYVMYDGDGNR